MKEKNKRLLIIIGVFLLFGGLALAYFVGRMLTGGEGATTTVTTASVKNSTVTVRGTLEFTYDGMLPGHTEISGVEVTATGNNELIPFDLIWEGSNTLTTNLNFTVYKSSNETTYESNCEKIKKNVSGGQMLYEECSIPNLENLGDPIATGTITNSTQSSIFTLAKDEFITSTENGTKMYYYVVLEYPNLSQSQNDDMDGEKGFDGIVKVQASDIEPDINIIATYIENKETGKYESSNTIPENYILNEQESSCTNDAIPKWNSTQNGLLVTNLNKSGTSCELYYDKVLTSKEVLEDTLKQDSKGDVPSITGPACGSCTMTDSGIYKTEDDFGDSYVYRGTVDNNWVVFGKDKTGSNYIWWRIIRINGNGTIRLIYAGTSTSPKSAPETTGNTTMIKPRTEINTTDQYRMAVRFNEQYNDNKYVGYMYGGTKGQASTGYDAAHKPETKSTVLEEIEYWYNNSTNLGDLAEQYIDVETGFCGDRGVDTASVSGYTGQGYGTQQTAYAPWTRLYNGSSWKKPQTPTLKCGKDTAAQKRDLYTGPSAKGTKSSSGTLIEGNNKLPVPVGLITSDEVVFAGGFGGASNNGYWLYTDRHYWTMSPSRYYSSSSNQYAYVFVVFDNGSLNFDYYVYDASTGLRPVINLKADTKLTTSGGGTEGSRTNPYIVET